jgi:hypothetical protein
MDDPTSAIKRPDAPLCPRCAGEQARTYRPGAPEDRPQITSPDTAADLLVPLLQHLDREQAVTLNLDAKHRLIATTTVSIGSVDHTLMSPREVFRTLTRRRTHHPPARPSTPRARRCHRLPRRPLRRTRSRAMGR